MRRAAGLALVVVALTLIPSLPAGSQSPIASNQIFDANDPPAALARILRAQRLDERWFAPALLAEVPLDRLTSLRGELTQAHGAYKHAERDGARWVAVLDRARVPLRIAFDSRGRVRSLFFERAIAVPRSFSLAVAAYEALPGQAALIVVDGGQVRAARDPDRPLGVGSAFKMLVLREYAVALASGRLKPEHVVALRPEWKAPGSGMIGTWPDGTPVALGTLATMMIAISDNTATDALMQILGRERIDAAASPRTRPLMTTRELHLLRLHREPDLLARWRSGDIAARREVLAALPAGRDLEAVWGDTLAHDIDYQFTARELCELIEAVGERPEMRVNPGPAAALGWGWSAYKGGSTDTSISSTVLAGRGTRRVCVAAIWNRTPRIERERFQSAVRGILGALAAE